MDQSLFRGQSLGGQDVMLLPAIGVAVAYLAVVVRDWLRDEPTEHSVDNLTDRHSRIHQAGCFVFLVVVYCLVCVHALKWGWGRARPSVAMFDASVMTAWFEPGGMTMVDMPFSGSFPSGHTATSLVAVIASLVFMRGWLRGVGVALGLLWGLAMAISRSVLAHHWASDGVLYLLVASLVMIVQIARWRTKKIIPPAIWLLWSLCAIIVGAGVGALGLGLRSLGAPNAALCAIVGMVLISVGAGVRSRYGSLG